MHYKTLKKNSDVINFKNYLNENNFILLFDIDSNNISTFTNLLKENNIDFLSLNSLQINSTKNYKELYNMLSGNTIMISLDNIDINNRTSIINTLLDNSKLYAFLKGIIIEKKIFRSNNLKKLLTLNYNISTNFVQYLFLSLKRINSVLVNTRRNN